MTLTQKRLYLKLTRNSFCIFLSANDIVSYREFISGPLHVRLKQICPNRGPIDGFVPFSVLASVINILTYWQPLLILIIFNLPFLMQAVLITTLTRGITRAAQIPGRTVTMGTPNDYRFLLSKPFGLDIAGLKWTCWHAGRALLNTGE